MLKGKILYLNIDLFLYLFNNKIKGFNNTKYFFIRKKLKFDIQE